MHKWKPSVVCYVLLFPVIVFLAVFSAYPLVYSITVSLHDYDLTNPLGKHFIGLGNYKELLFSPFSRFWESLHVAVLYTSTAVLIEFVLGLSLALLLSKELRGGSGLKTVLLLPLGVSPLLGGLIWRFMYNLEFGIITYFLKFLSIPEINWLGMPTSALLAVIVVDIWRWTPFMFLLFITGLVGLPREPYESAEVDGASPSQIFKYITLPLLKPVILVALLLRTIEAFVTFDPIYVLTHGGPASATEVLSMYTYLVGFKFFNTGEAAAISWLMVIIVVFVCMIYIKLLGESPRVVEYKR